MIDPITFLISMTNLVIVLIFSIKLLQLKHAPYGKKNLGLNLNLSKYYMLQGFILFYMLCEISQILSTLKVLPMIWKGYCISFKTIFFVSSCIAMQFFCKNLIINENLNTTKLSVVKIENHKRKIKKIEKLLNIYLIIQVLLQSAIFVLNTLPYFFIVNEYITLIVIVLNNIFLIISYTYSVDSNNKTVLGRLLIYNFIVFMLVAWLWSIYVVDINFIIKFFNLKNFYQGILLLKGIGCILLFRWMFCKAIEETICVSDY